MSMENSKIRLREIYEGYKKPNTGELHSLNKIAEDVENEKWFHQGFHTYNEMFAFHEWFNNQDLSKMKQHFYKCGRMLEFETKKYNANILSYSLSHFGYLLLSDNASLISHFADFRFHKSLTRYEYLDGVERGYGDAISYTIQCIVKEDWAEYERILPILTTKVLKRNKLLELDVTFFQAFAVGDKAKMEACLNSLVASKMHKRRNIMPLVNDFVSHPAVGYAKLAWLKGIEVEVNSPLVPKEWLPVQPLKEEEYIDYDFVKTYLG